MQQEMVVQKVGFFKGLSMMWSSMVSAIVKLFSAVDDGAAAIKVTTGVLRQHAEQWELESQMEFEAALAEKTQELAAKKALTNKEAVTA
jgi:hypothetical protein